MSAAVSIILPTYNRARFLPQAIESICAQEFTDWELIIVDDGSTDETPELLPQLTANILQPVRIIRQENQGAYAARNTGLDHATGRYIAFFDSDDLWLPHHLRDCANALDDNPDVDWVYGACRIVDVETGDVISKSSFLDGGCRRAFRKLPCTLRGELHVLQSRELLAVVLDGAGLFSGPQNSVVRKSLYSNYRFGVSFYNEAEDRLAVIHALAENATFAYFDNIHVVYQIHGGNSSGAAKCLDNSKRIRLVEGMILGYERLAGEVCLSPRERRALRRRLSRMYFWDLGYSTLWQTGRYVDAIAAYREALQQWPWDWRYWKTAIVCLLRLVRDARNT